MSTNGCPRGACGHSAYEHDGYFSSHCAAEGCPCGQSRAQDHRARRALRLDGWRMSADEMQRRGLAGKWVVPDHACPRHAGAKS